MSKREEELERQMLEKAHIYGEKRWKRIKITFFVLWAGIFLMILINGGLDSISDMLWMLGITAPMSVAVMFISYGVLYYIITRDIEEIKELYQLKGQLLERQHSRVFKDDE